MDDNRINEQILHELRLQTRIHRKSFIPILAVLLVFVAFSAIYKHYTGKNNAPKNDVSLTWNQIDELCDKGNYAEAEKQALIIVNRNAEDYYSHACLARIYLRKGDLPQALKHAEIAYRLFPNKDNEETLEALNKLLATGRKRASETK